MIAIEAILGDIARTLGLDPLDVRLRNLYGVTSATSPTTGCRWRTTSSQPLLSQLERTRLPRGRRDRAPGTRGSPVIKRGIAVTPVKFGISFTATFFNQAGALVHVYTDGSVQVNHGGTEMGQGLHTKVAQIVADELGVPFERACAHRRPTPARCQHLGHGGIQRHRPERPGRAVRGAQRARQPGRLRQRARRLRRRRRDASRTAR